MSKTHSLTRLSMLFFVILGIHTAPAHASNPSISVRPDGPVVQYGTSCSRPSQEATSYDSAQCKPICPSCWKTRKVTKIESKWSEWLATALSNSPSVKAELDSWSRYAGARPQITVRASEVAAPSENSSYPLGLSAGKLPTISVFVAPKTEGSTENSSGFSPYMLRLRPILTEAYREVTRQYYQLGGAFLKQGLLSQRHRAMEELLEINREAATSGEGSWAGVIYMTNLLDEVNSEIAKNNLHTEVMAFSFQQSPQLSELQMGALHVWSEDDFWDFYPKTPGPVIGDKAIPGTAVNELLEQLQSANQVANSSRASSALHGVLDQLDSEASASDADFAAGEEIVLTAKLKELGARLKYVDELVRANDGVKVLFSFGAAPAKPSPASSNYAKDGGTSGKLIGVLVLIAFLLGLWYFRRQPGNIEPEPSDKEKKGNTPAYEVSGSEEITNIPDNKTPPQNN